MRTVGGGWGGGSGRVPPGALANGFQVVLALEVTLIFFPRSRLLLSYLFCFSFLVPFFRKRPKFPLASLTESSTVTLFVLLTECSTVTLSADMVTGHFPSVSEHNLSLPFCSLFALYEFNQLILSRKRVSPSSPPTLKGFSGPRSRLRRLGMCVACPLSSSP